MGDNERIGVKGDNNVSEAALYSTKIMTSLDIALDVSSNGLV